MELEQLELLEAEIETQVVEPKHRPAKVGSEESIRHFRGWAIDKLDVFRLYLSMYRRVAGGGVYIDGFAGSGRLVADRDSSSEESSGSPIRALESGAFKFHHLVELSPTHVSALEQLIATRTERERNKVAVYQGDSNAVIEQILDAWNPEFRRCFAFLDPNSTQLDFRTVRRLARHFTYECGPDNDPERPAQCKIELWILFNDKKALQRMWPADRIKHELPIGAESLDRVFGGRESWLDVWDSNGTIPQLRARYADLLRDLGYFYVSETPIFDPDSGSVAYHMIHASDHPAAQRFMAWARRRLSIDAGRGVQGQLPNMSD